MQKQIPLLLITAVLGVAVAVVGTLEALECVSGVVVVTVFAGASGAGAALTAPVQQWRSGRSAHAPV